MQSFVPSDVSASSWEMNVEITRFINDLFCLLCTIVNCISGCLFMKVKINSIISPGRILVQWAALVYKRIRPGCIEICHRVMQETKPSRVECRSRWFLVVSKDFQFKYSSTCHERTPSGPGKSVPTWQVAARQRDGGTGEGGGMHNTPCTTTLCITTSDIHTEYNVTHCHPIVIERKMRRIAVEVYFAAPAGSSTALESTRCTPSSRRSTFIHWSKLRTVLFKHCPL